MGGKGKNNASRSNQTTHFGIMGGLGPTGGAHAVYLNRANNLQKIPAMPEPGLEYMRTKNILSKNPTGSGGVGRAKVLADRVMGPCNCKTAGASGGGSGGGGSGEVPDTISVELLDKHSTGSLFLYVTIVLDRNPDWGLGVLWSGVGGVDGIIEMALWCPNDGGAGPCNWRLAVRLPDALREFYAQTSANQPGPPHLDDPANPQEWVDPVSGETVWTRISTATASAGNQQIVESRFQPGGVLLPAQADWTCVRWIRPKTEMEGDWKMVESRSNPGEFYYRNTVTGHAQWDGPRLVENSNWIMVESRSTPGEFYYRNTVTGHTQWDGPRLVKNSNWIMVESRSTPGEFYYRNTVTGHTQWDLPAG